jgi:signal transduction histidine kinase
LGVLCVFAVLFVLGDVLERRLFPDLSTGWHHGFLTLRAALATIVASLVVYLTMRRQERELSKTAGQLSRLLESYEADRSSPGHFENPHLVHCREILHCSRKDCAMYDQPQERCWQIKALRVTDGATNGPGIQIQQCHRCKVYRAACPDRLTELGESFNCLMFLLAEEAARLGRMRAQMVEKEKMVAIGQMAAGIAHEIGNPLSSISAIVQVLKRWRGREAKSSQLDLIETHIQRISTTVRQLVSLARPVTEEWESIDIGKTIEDAIRLIRLDRRARNVEMICDLSPTRPATYALRGQLHQVFINLALNALDAMPDGGRLKIRARVNHRHIDVSFADTGCGISPEVGRKIFDPFFTTKEPGQGTGLGLSVSYGIIQKHGGTIDFESTVGAETTFRVRLPILGKPPEG